MNWRFSDGTMAPVGTGTRCLAAPSTLTEESQILKVQASSTGRYKLLSGPYRAPIQVYRLIWLVGASRCDTTRDPAVLETVPGDRALVCLGGKWRLLSRSA